MLGLLPSAHTGQARIYLYSKETDLRKSFDGLFAIVQSEFRQDVRQGDLFLFLNRRQDRIKLYYWDASGPAIWMKRLEQGNFQRPLRAAEQDRVELDATDLVLLLAGIDVKTAKRRPRYVVTEEMRAQLAPREK